MSENIVVPKIRETLAVKVDGVSGFEIPQGEMLPMMRSSNQLQVTKIIEGEPRLVEATYYGVAKVPYQNGKYGIISQSPLTVRVDQFIESWGGTNIALTMPTFTFDNNVNRDIKVTNSFFESTAFLVTEQILNPLSLELSETPYNVHEYYEATVAGLKTRCLWQKILAGSVADFILVPYAYYLTNGTHTFEQKYEMVKPTIVSGQPTRYQFPIENSPVDISLDFEAELPMGKEYIENGEIVYVPEISIEHVPENAPLDTIYLCIPSGRKVNVQDAVCRGWGKRQSRILYPSWDIDPIEEPTYLMINGVSDKFTSMIVRSKTSAWGDKYRFAIHARIKGSVSVNKPIFGLSKWELDFDAQKFSKIQYGVYGDEIPSQSFSVLAQNDNTQEYVATGRLPNLTYFSVRLQNNGNFVEEFDFTFRLQQMFVTETGFTQIGYSFDSSRSRLPESVSLEQPYDQFGTNNTYQLQGVPTNSLGTSLIQNEWGQTLIWLSHTPNKFYALLKNGVGYNEVDLSPLEVDSNIYEPYSFKKYGKLILFVWKHKTNGTFKYQIAYIAIWIEYDKINIDYERVVYNPLICYAKRLGKRSPLTKVK